MMPYSGCRRLGVQGGLIHYIYDFLTVGELVSPVPAEPHLLCEGMCGSGKCEKVMGPTMLLFLLGIV